MSNPWDFSRTMMAADEANFRDRQYNEGQVLRNLQMENLRSEMKERQGLTDFRAGWSPYLQQNRSLLEPTTLNTTQPMSNQEVMTPLATGAGEMAAPGGVVPTSPGMTRDVSTTIPAKESYQSLYGKYALEKGQPEIGLKMMGEARKTQGDELKEALSILDSARKLAQGGNKKAANTLLEAAKQMSPLLKDMEIETDAKTGFNNLIIPQKDQSGNVIGHTIIVTDQDGKAVGTPHFEANKGTETVSKTIYGQGGQTKQVAIPKEGEYTPPKGWSLKEPEKPDKPDKPDTFDKKMALTQKTFVDKNKRKPTSEEVVNEYKKQWGSEDLLSGILELAGMAGGGTSKKPPVSAPEPKVVPQKTEKVWENGRFVEKKKK